MPFERENLSMRKVIPCLIILLCILLPGKIVSESSSGLFSGSLPFDRGQAVEQEHSDAGAFDGQVIDLYILPETFGGSFTPFSFRIQPFSSHSTWQQTCGYSRFYYNGVQQAAYRAMLQDVHAGIPGWQGTRYYIYTLREIII